MFLSSVVLLLNAASGAVKETTTGFLVDHISAAIQPNKVQPKNTLSNPSDNRFSCFLVHAS